jgi:hypothetical protein
VTGAAPEGGAMDRVVGEPDEPVKVSSLQSHPDSEGIIFVSHVDVLMRAPASLRSEDDLGRPGPCRM